MYLKVAGVTFENRQEIIKKELNIGSSVKFFHEQNNKFDRYAVRIETSNGMQIGYVPKESSETVYNLLRKDTVLDGKVVAIRGFSQNENLGVGIYLNSISGTCDYKNYNSRKIKNNGLVYKVIDYGEKTEYKSYYVSLQGFKDKYDSRKEIKIDYKFQTFWQKVFYGDEYYYFHNVAKRAFANNTTIQSVDLDLVNGAINQEAFINCSNLEKLKISCDYIDDGAFNNCSKLNTVDIYTKNIGNETFKNCINISSIKITKYLERIGVSSFEGCSSISKIDLSESYLTTIPKRTFADCTSLKEITLPHTLNVIESEAFMNCTNLEKITFKGELFKIDKDAFINCKNLNSVIFQDNVKILSETCFRNCESLTEIKFQKHLYEIRDNAFEGCNKLKKIFINVSQDWIEKFLTHSKSLNIDLVPFGIERKVRVITDPDEALRLMEEMNDAIIESWIDKYS